MAAAAAAESAHAAAAACRATQEEALRLITALWASREQAEVRGRRTSATHAQSMVLMADVGGDQAEARTAEDDAWAMCGHVDAQAAAAERDELVRVQTSEQS
jgi:hypothetical protein